MARLNKGDIKEPSILVKPITKFGGLDNIHLSLIVLIVILVMLLLFLSYTKQVTILNATNGTNCTYGSINGSCIQPIHNTSQVQREAEKLLAAYGGVNGSISALPYSSDVQAMNITYIASSRSWYASVPVSVPGSQAFTFSMLISDSNLSRIVPFIQAVKPSVVSDNYVTADGVVRLAGQTTCGNSGPLKVYWFVDPYAPGGINTLSNLTSLRQQFGNNVNISLYIQFENSSYYQQIVNAHNASKAQALGGYLFCSSLQGPSQFSRFIANLNSVYTSAYISPAVLSNVSIASGLNMTQMSGCLAGYAQKAAFHIALAQHYGLVSTPAVVTDCQYLSIPQTAREAVCYANSTICASK